MNHWIIILPREDMEHCIKIGTFGMNRKQIIDKVQMGDKLACYITKESKIIALGDVTESYYLDSEKVFIAEGLFPDRFKFKASLLNSHNEIDFRSMVDDFQFITNKLYWTVYLRTGIAKIPSQDWRLIESKLAVSIS
ncbi:MAG: EVE domain-containing protein [Cyanobacteria bacterium]|nr:EVE domain-containing protein [Cyanobacteriota bacterium]